ncbi:Ankyrin repeat-containing domain protein [Rhypophila sp. PSN 637]
MIILAITSTRSLSTSEFAALLAIQKSRRFGEIARNTATEIEHDVRTLCLSLLSCARGFVGPFHHIVGEFFHSKACPTKFRVDRGEAQGVFAKTCLKCLRFMQIPADRDAEVADPLGYAADNFLYHTMQASEATQMELANPIRNFLWSKENFTLWLQFVWDTGELLRQDLALFQIKSAILTKDFELGIPYEVTPIHILALVAKSQKLFSKLAFEASKDDVWFDFQQTDSQGRSVLHWASGEDAETINQDEAVEDDGIVQYLVSRGLDPNTKANNGRSPMHIVAQHGSCKNFISLYKSKADCNAKDKSLLTPLHLSVMFPGSIERLLDLLKVGAEVDTREKYQWTPLHFAAQNGHAGAIGALVAAGASVDAQEEHKATPLHLAAQNGHAEAIGDLVAAGVSVDVQTEKGNSPLHFAARNGHAEAIAALVAAGASVDAQENKEWTPLHFAAQNGHAGAIGALMAAGASAIGALVAAGAIVDVQTEKGNSPLHFAARNGHAEAVAVLVAVGASVDAQEEHKATPLHLAAQNGHAEAVAALVAAGASVDAQEEHKVTPLHLAASNAHGEVIAALVAAGASVDAREEDQWTPLHFAA